MARLEHMWGSSPSRYHRSPDLVPAISKGRYREQVVSVPLISVLLPSEVLAHIRSPKVYVAGAGGDAVEDRVRHQLTLDAAAPFVLIVLSVRDHAATDTTR